MRGRLNSGRIVVIVQAPSIAWPIDVGKFSTVETNATIAHELKTVFAI